MEPEKDKPALSHTHSLPTSKNKQSRSSSEEGRASGGAGSPASNQGPRPKFVGRSQSVRTKSTSNKVWNLGSMAKAVGSGMTALGSNVVSGSMAVGSEVYHGTVVVGTNVVEGTKAAGRVTKDVTLAAGKGVVHAGEVVADTTVQAGKMVASASVTAVQDTVDKTTMLIEEGIDLVDPTSLEEEVEGTHLVLPGEDLQTLSNLYGTTVEAFIRANGMTSRRLLPGTRVTVPADQVEVLPPTHPMENLRLDDANVFSGQRQSVLLSSDALKIGPAAQLDQEEQGEQVQVFRVSAGQLLKVRVEQPQEAMPELLPADSLGTAAAPASAVEDEETVVLTFVVADPERPERRVECKCAFADGVIAHANLWFPDLLDPASVFKYELQNDHLAEGEESGLGSSCILTKAALSNLHRSLPQQTRSLRWNRVYLSVLDGYSLQNFYRKMACFSEPFLLVIQDTEGQVFGAFLTNVPCATEEFIGTGESFLFKVCSHNDEVEVSNWSGTNHHFFQGKANCLVMGAAEGKFGIYVDGNLDRGRIDQCQTYQSWPPDGKNNDFKVKCLECYNFV